MKDKKLGLLPRLVLGILAGMLLGSTGGIFHSEKSIIFVGMVRLFSTFTSLFSTFLSFIIPLLILSFVTIGLADLGKKANKLFGITLAIAYCSTIIAGFSAFLTGKAILPGIIAKITTKELSEKTFDAIFTITADPVCSVMTALILAFILGLGIANTETKSLYNCIKEIQEIIKLVLGKIIIPLIPIHIAGLFCKIAAEGTLFPTIKMFIRLYILILAFQWIYISFQFCIASIVSHQNQFKKIKNIAPAYFTALGTQFLLLPFQSVWNLRQKMKYQKKFQNLLFRLVLRFIWQEIRFVWSLVPWEFYLPTELHHPSPCIFLLFSCLA